MKRSILVKGALLMTLALAVPTTAYAMPADIEEAVTDDSYNAYSVQNDYSYDDDDLTSIDADYVATARAMIRTAPFGEIIGSTTKGKKYHVIGECPDCMWYKVKSGKTTGYVYAMYLVPEKQYKKSTGSNSETGKNIRELDLEMTVTSASGVNVRTSPSTKGSIMGVVKGGDDVEVTGNVLTTNWYQVKYNGKTGYMCDDYLTPELPQTMACQAKSLNIRDKASMKGKVVGHMKYADKVRVAEVDGDWYKIQLDDGTVGYVYDQYMSVVK